MKFEESVEYIDGERNRLNLSSQFTNDQMRITNLSTGSLIDLKSSDGFSKYQTLNDEYDTFGTGTLKFILSLTVVALDNPKKKGRQIRRNNRNKPKDYSPSRWLNK